MLIYRYVYQLYKGRFGLSGALPTTKNDVFPKQLKK